MNLTRMVQVVKYYLFLPREPNPKELLFEYVIKSFYL